MALGSDDKINRAAKPCSDAALRIYHVANARKGSLWGSLIHAASSITPCQRSHEATRWIKPASGVLSDRFRCKASIEPQLAQSGYKHFDGY